MKTFKFNPKAKQSDIQLHVKTLESAIKYFESRKMKCDHLKLELDQLEAFYCLR